MNRRRLTAAACGCDPQVLGEIRGKLEMIHEAQKTHGAKLESMDSRLRHVENRSAIAGAVGGCLMAIGINVAGWWLRKPS